MSNQLKMVQINTIRTLLDQGWSQRRIARELEVSRCTVGRYARQFLAEKSNPAISTPGDGGAKESNPAISTPGKQGRKSDCDGHRDEILKKCEAGLSAKRIHQDLVSEENFAGSYQSVKRFVRTLVQSRVLPYRRMECAPGEEAQVDYGQGALTMRGKSYRRPNLFRLSLSFSRLGYTEASWTQTTEEFIRCMENAFHHFGGVPKTMVPDNLKAAVINPDWYDPDINPKFASFARHYGFAVMPTKPRTPRHKGKVESGVKYSQDNGAKGRKFDTIEEQNRFWLQWELGTADQRIHGTTQRQVRKLFEEEERGELLPLPKTRFPIFEEAERIVHRDGHIAVERAFYSVPPEYLGHKVWIRWNSHLVRVFNTKMEQICVHAKAEPGRFSTDAKHIPDEKVSGVERGEEYMLERARRIGPHAIQWAEQLLQNRGIYALRSLQGLLSLASKYTSKDINEACRIAVSHAAFRVRSLRQLLKETDGEQLHFMDNHPVIRDMQEYGEIVNAIPWPKPEEYSPEEKQNDNSRAVIPLPQEDQLEMPAPKDETQNGEQS